MTKQTESATNAPPPDTAGLQVLAGLLEAGLESEVVYNTPEGVRRLAGHDIDKELGSVRESTDTALQGFRDDLDVARKGISDDLAAFQKGINEDVAAFRKGISADVAAFRKGVCEDLAAFRKEVKEDLAAFREELSASLLDTQNAVALLAESVKDIAGAQASMKGDIHKLQTEVEGLVSPSNWARKLVWSLLAILVCELALIAKLALSPAPVTLRLPSSLEAPVSAVPQPSAPPLSESPAPGTQLPEPK